MVPAGYLLKHVSPPPGWLTAGLKHIKDVCSVADCVNDNVIDVQGVWLHNSFGLANNPDVIGTLAVEGGADVNKTTLFYYTAYELELESDGWNFDATCWRPRSPARSAAVDDNVLPPAAPSAVSLLGYDVVVFGDFLEHSPLSCNAVAEQLPVNEHCLMNTLEEAVAAIDQGAFGGGCEEGTYTIFGVHLVR
ncbi:hypothetical protein [Caenibius sp. WL]|uniref:hypothetical protein n=1 Tax=Caenibius sp. WL TaxID=2872646 RepID=UPI001C99F1AE|nr:hypothetical protein [Caenibius sp. WL]QZP07709.1 hypothetical protein K5X80_13795 [Caenibius sp. WL]